MDVLIRELNEKKKLPVCIQLKFYKSCANTVLHDSLSIPPIVYILREFVYMLDSHQLLSNMRLISL